MLAVFYKGKFVDFWHVAPGDQSWIDRTIAAKAWNPDEVEVHEYGYNRSGSEVILFDDQKNLQIMEAATVDMIDVDNKPMKDENGDIKKVEGVKVRETWTKKRIK